MLLFLDRGCFQVGGWGWLKRMCHSTGRWQLSTKSNQCIAPLKFGSFITKLWQRCAAQQGWVGGRTLSGGVQPDKLRHAFVLEVGGIMNDVIVGFLPFCMIQG